MKITFFPNCEDAGMRNGFSRYNLSFSEQFCEFFSENFTGIFIKETGLKPSSKVTLAGYKQNNDLPMYQPGPVSKLNLVL